MINKKLKYLLIVLVGILFLLPAVANAIGNGKEKPKMAKTTGSQIATTAIDINNIYSLEQNNGFSDFNPNSNLEGAQYPKGSGKNFVYTAGFLWGGFVPGDKQVRVGGSAYISGLQPGPIINGQGAPNPNGDSRWSIYRVRPDVYPGVKNVDLSGDAAIEGIPASQILAQYESDWTNWPAAGTANDLGAPFTDVNGDGKYEPGIDIPGVPGADQTVYYVANDKDPLLTNGLYGAKPLGIEVHVTFWAYAQQGALGNMYFKKWDIINKGQTPIDSMFVSYWTDVDLGNATDDLVGCDTTLSLQFTYNGQPTDAVYAPLPPPADGFDFFQGPVVPSAATDSAIVIAPPFKFQYIHGKKNLPMTSAYFFVNGDANFGDPPQGDITGSTQFYNFFNGNYGLSGLPFINPINNQPTKFAFSGDPVAGTGWLDGVALPPGDRRQGMASGPFTMAPNDTQQVVVAEMVAGAIPSVNYLQAITLVKVYDRVAQAAYNSFFAVAKAPPAPVVNAIPLNNKVVLDWGENQAAVAATENSSIIDPVFNGNYNFEGYNVYQLPSKNASIDQAKLLATYDVKDGITTVPYIDPVTLEIAYFKPIENGTDSGIKRSIIITNNAFNGRPLVNGIPYYFAVTAYSYDSTGIPRALENPISNIIITVIPHSNNPGVRYAYNPGDTIMAIHSSGKSQGEAFALVVDPTRLTGDQYKVTFDTTGGNITWSLTDITNKNTVVLSNQTDQSGDNNYSIVDGMMVKVTGPPVPGMNSGGQGVGWDIPKGTRRFTWAGNSLAANYGLEGFNGTIGWASPDYFYVSGVESVPANELCNTLITLAQVTDTSLFNPAFPPTSDVNLSYGYRYLRHASSPAADPRFASHIVNTTGGTYPFQEFAQTVPLSAWNVDDPAHPARLVVGYLENNVVGGLVDGKYWPPDYTQVDQATAREFLWIYQSPYTTTANPNFEVDALGSNPLPVMWFIMWERRGPVPFSPGGTGTDEFLIYANHINTLNDQFTFTATAPTKNPTLAKQDVNSINVFPNPYYGVNSQETTKYVRFVTFNHLPGTATIKIFNLAGILVKTINHTNGTQFQQWDLTNDSGLPVASGLYIAYIDMPGIGTTKILKLAIIQEQQYPDHF
ncbi:MAG: T9SS type A sorting domain-containing protein [Ignavibacteriaceae bacterium]